SSRTASRSPTSAAAASRTAASPLAPPTVSPPEAMSRATMLGDRTSSPADGDGGAATGGGGRGPDLTWAEVAPGVDHGATPELPPDPPHRHPPHSFLPHLTRYSIWCHRRISLSPWETSPSMARARMQ
ncbi:unnamed protein product, partial [Urochloa humidicola]